MNICIPITEDKGLQSPVSAHFGSAPMFLIVELDTMSCRTVLNRNAVHEHGKCQPFAAIAGEKVDAIIVGGIGMGALTKLQAARIRVMMAGNVQQVEPLLAAFKAGQLQEAAPHSACQGHNASATGACHHSPVRRDPQGHGAGGVNGH